METIISFNSAEDIICIYTADKSIKNKCVRNKFKLIKTDKNKGQEIAWHFKVPKNDFAWGRKKKMNLSDQQKEILSKRMKKINL